MRRGKYWKPDPARLEKAEQKRERRRMRNISQREIDFWRHPSNVV